ncbi:MAG: hypothetical protein NT002_10485 [candidate division Zixibacteria bacterium]|nr:hypothetical protein [candidate division Zixibacteria bacterium]
MIPGIGGSWGDYDNDGNLDLFEARFGINNDKSPLYYNNGNGNHCLEIRCAGSESNRSAIGTKVRVKAAIRGRPVWGSSGKFLRKPDIAARTAFMPILG